MSRCTPAARAMAPAWRPLRCCRLPSPPACRWPRTGTSAPRPVLSTDHAGPNPPSRPGSPPRAPGPPPGGRPWSVATKRAVREPTVSTSDGLRSRQSIHGASAKWDQRANPAVRAPARRGRHRANGPGPGRSRPTPPWTRGRSSGRGARGSARQRRRGTGRPTAEGWRRCRAPSRAGPWWHRPARGSHYPLPPARPAPVTAEHGQGAHTLPAPMRPSRRGRS